MVLFARALDLHLEPGNLAIKETDRSGEPVIGDDGSPLQVHR